MYRNPSEGMKNVQWKRHLESDPHHLEIDEQLKLVPEKLFDERDKFWRNL